MKEVEELRAWLRDQKGKYGKLAKLTGLSTKTISRIAHDPTWNLTLNTYTVLLNEKALAEKEEAAIAEIRGTK